MAELQKSNQVSAVSLAAPVALVTGGARRIGAALVAALHHEGYRVVIHYRQSDGEAKQLYQNLNNIRPDSAALVAADFNQFDDIARCATEAAAVWDRLDVVVNNASSFFATVVGDTDLEQWQQLINSNLMAPYFLVQAALPYLQAVKGQVINIADIHGERPLKGFAVYSTAKAGLIMLTQALARELGPDVQVNAIAPGVSCWPEHQQLSVEQCHDLAERTVLKRITAVDDISRALLFLLQQDSITGEVIHIDCGRLLK